ncbi:MAG: 3-deoxy-D-manno-octulosonic acid transferase [Alphaproteobacteria bacterium]|nr:3-deoxy-D-manno-octulosonic acid transferase [Alphaproteobacteria bacterium]
MKPPLLIAYRWLLRFCFPLILLWLFIRLLRGKELWRAIPQKFAFCNQPLPELATKKIIWLHAVSVGESLSALTVIEHFHRLYPDTHFLLTSSTVTSAKMIAKHQKNYFTHQFAPLDYPSVVKRFLRHFNPVMVLMFESEIWPHLLYYSHLHCQARLFLLQGRISPRTLLRWQKNPRTVSYLLKFYKIIFAQSKHYADAFQQLGAQKIMVSGNIKFLNSPLSYDVEKLALLQQKIGKRPFYVMASTHKGEEEIAIAAHELLAKKYPDFLTIIIPRHPERGSEIATLLQKNQLNYVRRQSLPKQIKLQKAKLQTAKLPNNQTQIYLADTLGETGLFYALAEIICVGGSFAPWGGHNIFEPLQLDAIPLHGASMYNCADMQSALAQAGLCFEVRTAQMLADKVSELLDNDVKRTAIKVKAKKFMAQCPQTLSLISQELDKYITQ